MGQNMQPNWRIFVQIYVFPFAFMALQIGACFVVTVLYVNCSFKALCILIFFWTFKTVYNGHLRRKQNIKIDPGLTTAISVFNLDFVVQRVKISKLISVWESIWEVFATSRWWRTFFCQFRLPSFLFRNFKPCNLLFAIF